MLKKIVHIPNFFISTLIPPYSSMYYQLISMRKIQKSTVFSQLKQQKELGGPSPPKYKYSLSRLKEMPEQKITFYFRFTNMQKEGARKIVRNQGVPFQNGKITICKNCQPLIQNNHIQAKKTKIVLFGYASWLSSKKPPKIRPEDLLNEITNYDTKLKEFNNDRTGFTVQNKCILKDYLNLLRD